jgi:glutathione S-transferase
VTTLYHTPRSSSTRVLWALEELGLPRQLVKVDLAAGEQKRPEYLALNPNGKVPLLVDDAEGPIFESAAILIQLGEAHGRPAGLWPAPGTEAHGQALAWTVWSTATFVPALYKLLMNTSERWPVEQHNALQAEVARKDLGVLVEILEGRLASRSYLLGDAFTLADIGPVSGILSLDRSGQGPSDGSRVRGWVERCTARPAYQRASAIV